MSDDTSPLSLEVSESPDEPEESVVLLFCNTDLFGFMLANIAKAPIIKAITITTAITLERTILLFIL